MIEKTTRIFITKYIFFSGDKSHKTMTQISIHHYQVEVYFGNYCLHFWGTGLISSVDQT